VTAGEFRNSDTSPIWRNDRVEVVTGWTTAGSNVVLRVEMRTGRRQGQFTARCRWLEGDDFSPNWHPL
jgi:hypothetical protein